MTLTRRNVARLVFLACVPVLLLGTYTACAADGTPSFKKRGDEEKKFFAAVGDAIIKAAHPTAKKIDLIKYELTTPKEKRAELMIKMEYHGAFTGKKYVADLLIKLDVADKDAWEVLNIDYTDNNNISANLKNVQALIKKLNQ